MRTMWARRMAKTRRRPHTRLITGLIPSAGLALGALLGLTLGASQADAFCSIAGGCEPSGSGGLAVTHLDADQQAIDLAVDVFLAGMPPWDMNRIAAGRTDVPIELPAGTYDVVVDTTPDTWRRDVTIVKGEALALTTGGYGRLLVSGLDPTGAPVDTYVWVYTMEDRDTRVMLDVTNTLIELPEAVYFVSVDQAPPATFEDIAVHAGQTTEVRLPDLGRLLLSGSTAAGEPVVEYFWIYLADGGDTVATGDTNVPVDLAPGVYDLFADLDPDRRYDGVEIVAGETTEVALPPYGALLVRGVDAQGEPLYAKSVYLYATGGDEIVSSGLVNERLDLPADIYDVSVDLNPDIWHRAIEIAVGDTVEIDLPQWGELEVRITDPAGAGVTRTVSVYGSADDERPVVSFVDQAGPVPPGRYAVSIDPSGGFDDLWLAEPVIIEAGKTTTLDLTLGDEDGEVPMADVDPELWLERTSFEPGELIIVRFRAPTSFAADAWIGLVPAEVAHGEESFNDAHDLDYEYLQNRDSGELSFTAPEQLGDYDFRMHDTDLSGREAASVGFSVTGAVAAGELLVTITGATGAPLGAMAYDLFSPGRYDEILHSGTVNEPAPVAAGHYDLRLNAEPAPACGPISILTFGSTASKWRAVGWTRSRWGRGAR